MNDSLNPLFLALGANIFDAELWAEVPFSFWAFVFFIFGCIVGSFLNVCIHRMPLNESLVSPPSHCPRCRYSIPWYLNVPLVTWLWLRGRCANCKAPISARYFLVELLTGLLFLLCWLRYGGESAGVALILSIFFAGLVVATFIDIEHYIIPDEITLGGWGVGVALSALVPSLHIQGPWLRAVMLSLLGSAVGAGLTYAILRLGKLLFGRQKLRFDEPTRVEFTETGVLIEGEETPFDEIFYRRSDRILFRASKLEALGRTWSDAPVRLSVERLEIGDESFNPEEVPLMIATTQEITIPREAMGFGDVKFMGAIGAFLGWPGAIFSLMASALIGAVFNLALIACGRREWSSKLPYGPYIAIAAGIWVFAGRWMLDWYLARVG
ncbi:MAG: prepilin peptidase [Verrucomicrobia bacterium]|nr:prepilin peptidase [Verrucomicrobiota bacterium]MBI3868236.1 prepilin peptidase [Verrucomicrobiota bacterium]